MMLGDGRASGVRITCCTAGGPDEDEADAWSSLLAAAGHYGWIAALRLDAPATGQPRTDPPGGLLLFSRGPTRRPCTGVTEYAIIWVSFVPDDHHVPMLMPEVHMSITEVEAAYTEAAR
jgi:hypothetical protein